MQNYDRSSTKRNNIVLLYSAVLTLFCHSINGAKLINNSSPIIVIDAGHGGHDSGAVGLFSKEKDITLSICQKLGWILMDKMPSATILYTRNSDEFLPLYRRAAVANQNRADLFLSIHCNAVASHQESNRGTETFVLGMHKAEENLEIVKKENEVMNMEDNSAAKYYNLSLNNTENHIIQSLYQTADFDESIKLASMIEKKFESFHPGKSRGVKQAGFVVLSQITMPGLLIETGFISNQQEEIYLNSEEGQFAIATQIADAIVDYYADSDIYDLLANNNNIEQLNRLGLTSKSVEAIPASIIIKEEIPEHIEYKIQIAASKGEHIKMNQSAWQHISQYQILKEGDYYKYQVGPFTSKEEASIEKEKLKQFGFTDAFLIPYKNGIRMN